MATFALCTTLRNATTEQLKNPDYCKPFIGALWIPEFIAQMKAAGHEVVSGKDALKTNRDQVSQKALLHNLHVIQEDRSIEGRALLKRGAHGAVLFCLESPLYAPTFYDFTEFLSQKFKHTTSFHRGAHLGFPSFSHPTPRALPWNLRRPLCMITSPKHYSGLRQSSRRRSKAFQEAVAWQLQDHRYDAIRALKPLGMLDLYGRGWPSELAHPVENKLNILAAYKFAICFENVAMHGYITEKLFHALEAGTIPIYLGAPDIMNHVPKELFIDFREFSGWDGCLSYLSTIDSTEAHKRIQYAMDWLLNSPQAQKYTYEGFSKRMVTLCLDALKEQAA